MLYMCSEVHRPSLYGYMTHSFCATAKPTTGTPTLPTSFSFFPIPNRENHATVQNCRENDHIHIADATQYPRTDFLKVNLYNLEF
jgi:hypothetical protein